MKNSLLKNVLDWVLATSLVLSIVFFVQFFFRTRELRSTQNTIQVELSTYQNNHGVLNLLLKDSEDYSRTHPDLNHILDSVRADKTVAGKPAGN